MSGIAGLFGECRCGDEDAFARITGPLRARGADRTGVWRVPGAMLAVSRHEWEGAPAFAGDSLIVDDGTVVVAADATLYYRDELRRRLAARGVHLSRDCSPSDAILAAYYLWGDDAPRELEGDFAFILWDRRRQRALCTRDFGGKRPLHYALIGESLVIASTLTAIAEHPRFSAELNLAVLAETISQFWSDGDDTCYARAKEVLAGTTLTWMAGQSPRINRHWEPPEIGGATRAKFEEDAEQLRSLLMRAAEERLSPAGATAVWMSGGWDSSSVFAAGQAVLRDTSRNVERTLHPVSISYPKGDPGREDELIEAIAGHWRAPIHWLDVEQIPLLDGAVERALRRDAPFAHTYELWNRALANGSRAVGARVAFDGNGGDQLFQVSDVFLSDLFRSGRLISLSREWRTKGAHGLGTLFDWVIAPNLPGTVKRWLTTSLGRRFADDLERPVAPWVRADFSHQHALVERERKSMPVRPGYRGWRREAHFILAAQVFPRAFQCLSSFALDAGVELRSPLYDRRVVEFACQRPREERNSGRETKRLLRAAMRGLLPADVLAPRAYRTGITTAYSDRRLRESFPGMLEAYLTRPILADLGIVEPATIRASWDEYCRTGNLTTKIALYLTLNTELWLRARASGRGKSTGQIVPAESRSFAFSN